MNVQEVFDKVAKHLLTQGVRSINRLDGDEPGQGSCAYRGDNGTMCAVGCLIEDDHYTVLLEGGTVRRDDVQEALLKSGVPTTAGWLLADLQALHDSRDPSRWKEGLGIIARVFYLDGSVLNSF